MQIFRFGKLHLSTTAILIIINIAVFILVRLLNVNPHLVCIASDFTELTHSPWTIFSYMFVHYSFWHLVMNMLWLYMFGRVIELTMPGRYLTWFYVVGGLGGALLYVAGSLTATGTGILCGASAAVVAIMAAAGLRSPNLEIRLFIFGSIRLKWVVAAGIIFLFVGTGGGGFWAHLGGLITGVLAMPPFLKLRHRTKTPKQHKPSARRIRKMNKTLQQRQKDMARLDTLLDQVKLSGFDSLSKSEKSELQRLSKTLSHIPSSSRPQS